MTRRAAILADLQHGLSQPTPPRISIKAQRFTLVDSAGVQTPVQMHDPHFGMYLDVVIVGVNPNKSKIYYQDEYDPNNDVAPTCFSDNGVAASAQASAPQNAEGGFLCATCPNNMWGSDVSKMTGKATKLCSDRRKLAVLVVGDPSGGICYQFQVPPASLKNLSVYAAALGTHQIDDPQEGKRPCDPADVVTRLYFNPQKQGELFFQPMGYHMQLVPQIAQQIAAVDATDSIAYVTGKSDVPYQGAGRPALAAPQAQPALAAPQPQMQAPPPAPMQQVMPPQQFAPPTAPLQNGFAPPQPQQAAPQPQAAPTARGGARRGAGRPRANAAPAQAPAPQAAPNAAPFPPQQPMAAPQMAAPQMAQPQMAQPQAAPAPATQQPAPFQMAQPVAAPAPAATPAQPAFGMQNGAAPDPGLSAALQNAFGSPMQPRPRG